MYLYRERLNHAFEYYFNCTFKKTKKNIIMKYHYKAPTGYYT